MAYTRHAYIEFSGMLARTLDEINEDPALDRDGKIADSDAVNRVVEKIAEIFEADNPKGFDKDRFFDDVYGPEE